MDFLQKHIEALIFCAPKPINLEILQNCLSEMFETEVPEQDVLDRIEKLTEKYQSDEFSFEIIEAGGGFQFMTKPAYQESIGSFPETNFQEKTFQICLGNAFHHCLSPTNYQA